MMLIRRQSSLCTDVPFPPSALFASLPQVSTRQELRRIKHAHRPCMQAGPYAVALMIWPGLTFTGCGGLQRFLPDVSSAKGTPSHLCKYTEVVLVSTNPCTRPDVVSTRRSLFDESASEEEVDASSARATTANTQASTKP